MFMLNNLETLCSLLIHRSLFAKIISRHFMVVGVSTAPFTSEL